MPTCPACKGSFKTTSTESLRTQFEVQRIATKKIALTCNKGNSKHARHSEVNSRIKASLAEMGVVSMLEPVGMTRDDEKRPEGATVLQFERGFADGVGRDNHSYLRSQPFTRHCRSSRIRRRCRGGA